MEFEQVRYKRTFIPPNFRPFVTGTNFASRRPAATLMDTLKDDRLRREKITSMAMGENPINGLDIQWAREILFEIFPTLRGLEINNHEV